MPFFERTSTRICIILLFANVLIALGCVLGDVSSTIITGQSRLSWKTGGAIIGVLPALALGALSLWAHVEDTLWPALQNQVKNTPAYAQARAQWAQELAYGCIARNLVAKPGATQFFPASSILWDADTNHRQILHPQPFVRRAKIRAASAFFPNPWHRVVFARMQHEPFDLPKLSAHQTIAARRTRPPHKRVHARARQP